MTTPLNDELAEMESGIAFVRRGDLNHVTIECSRLERLIAAYREMDGKLRDIEAFALAKYGECPSIPHEECLLSIVRRSPLPGGPHDAK